MNDIRRSIVVFRIGSQRHAVRLSAAARAIRAAEITPVEDAPAPVLGLLDVQGSVLPVLSLRRRLNAPEPELDPQAHFLIVHLADRRAAIVVDEVLGIDHVAAEVDPGSVIPGLEQYEGITCLEGGLVFIHDLDRFFSADDWRRLDRLLPGPTQ